MYLVKQQVVLFVSGVQGSIIYWTYTTYSVFPKEHNSNVGSRAQYNKTTWVMETGYDVYKSKFD